MLIGHLGEQGGGVVLSEVAEYGVSRGRLQRGNSAVCTAHSERCQINILVCEGGDAEGLGEKIERNLCAELIYQIYRNGIYRALERVLNGNVTPV